MYRNMKKTYIEPQNTVVRIETEQFIAESLTRRAGVRGEDAEARETLITEETTIIARNAWLSW